MASLLENYVSAIKVNAVTIVSTSKCDNVSEITFISFQNSTGISKDVSALSTNQGVSKTPLQFNSPNTHGKILSSSCTRVVSSPSGYSLVCNKLLTSYKLMLAGRYQDVRTSLWQVCRTSNLLQTYGNTFNSDLEIF